MKARIVEREIAFHAAKEYTNRATLLRPIHFFHRRIDRA